MRQAHGGGQCRVHVLCTAFGRVGEQTRIEVAARYGGDGRQFTGLIGQCCEPCA